MTTWFNSIIDGLKIYALVAPIVTVLLLTKVAATKKFNIAEFVLDELLVLYLLCILSLVFFPLPSFEEAKELTGYHGRFYFGAFIKDIYNDKSVVSVFQVLFNIAMTVPFGMYLSYRAGLKKADVIFLSLLLSLFFELGQLTGLFFIFKGSYRLFDFDDLMFNTLGGFTGYVLMTKLSKFVRPISDFESKKVERKLANAS